MRVLQLIQVRVKDSGVPVYAVRYSVFHEVPAGAGKNQKRRKGVQIQIPYHSNVGAVLHIEFRLAYQVRSKAFEGFALVLGLYIGAVPYNGKKRAAERSGRAFEPL